MRPLCMIQCGSRWLYSCRFLHSTPIINAATGQLSKLRKKTGFSISKCKNALDKFEGDLSKAEAWLREQAQKEGWAKATKLQGRAMSQGLVGVTVENRTATMVEINCETDFVARNQKFQGLVSQAANLCMQEGKKSDFLRIDFSQEDINKLSNAKGQSLADLVALEVGNIGENMSVRRGIFLQTPEGQSVGAYIHTADTKHVKEKCIMGKYGALVTFSQSEDRPEGALDTAQLGNQLALHVVGMNPNTIGTIEKEAEAEPAESVNEPSEKQTSEENVKPKKSKKSKKKKKKEDEEEARMLHQMFIGDDKITVAEFLEQNGAAINSFIRYECGEDLSTEKGTEESKERSVL